MPTLTSWIILAGVVFIALLGYGLGLWQARRGRSVMPSTGASGARSASQAGSAEARLAFQAEAASVLAAGMEEPATALADLVRRAVPQYAEACLVDLSALDPTLQILASSVPDPDHPGERLVRLDRPDMHVAAAVLDPQVLNAENGWVEDGYVAAPICRGNRRIGSLAFVAGQSGRRYGPTDLVVAEELAERVMTALERSLAYRQMRVELEQTADRADRLRRLVQLSSALYSSATLPGLLRVAVDEARRLTGAARAVISCWLEEPGSQPLHLAADQRSESGEAEADEAANQAADTGLAPEMAGLCRLVCHSGRPMRMTRTELVAHPVFRAALTDGQMPALPLGWMAVPITRRDGRNLGLIQVFDTCADAGSAIAGEFTADAESLLLQLCDLTAAALENLRLWRASISVEERLRSQLRATGALAASMGEGVCAVDEAGRCTFVNATAQELLGWTESELLGRPLYPLLHWQSDDGQEMDQNPLALALQGITVRQEDELFVRRDHSVLPVACSIAPLLVDGRMNGAVIVFSDMSSRKALEEQLAQQAFHDALTGLPNRLLFVNRLEHALARSRRRKKSIALLFVDLDGFKVVNDQLGHDAGDRLLTGVAQRLSRSIRAGDTAARISGDEFTLLLEEVADEAEALQVAHRVREAILQPLQDAGQDVQITASIGVAVSPTGDHRPDVLLRQADAAMYQAKSRGKNRCVLFEPS